MAAIKMPNPTKTQAIKQFLTARAPEDLAALYNPAMEVQVNVAQDGGELVEGEYKGHHWRAWTDGLQTWKPIRIPHKANTADPEFADSEIKFDLAAHADAIGMTGWDWVAKVSRWVAFDFDAICGHSEKHDKKLSTEQLAEVQKLACQIPWVTVRRSTSGNGLHLYVHLKPVPTTSHTEHAALGRAILGKLSAITGFDFNAKVDVCGGNLWVWARKYEAAGGRTGLGLRMIKRGVLLEEPPINWRDHVKVASGARRKTAPGFIESEQQDAFEAMCGQSHRVPLDDEHRRLIKYLEDAKAMWWFDSDHHMLVCHTYDLAQAHKTLALRGIFKTVAQGEHRGTDINCFAFPMRRGGWVVRRYSEGVGEADTWEQDASGYTKCYFNRAPDLKTAARSAGGLEDDSKVFEFATATEAKTAIKALGGNLDLPDVASNRKTRIKPSKDGRSLIVELDKLPNESGFGGWIDKKKTWRKVIPIQLADAEPEIANFDDLVRHVISESGTDCGWVIKADKWIEEPFQHVKAALAAMGNADAEIKLITGSSVLRPWKLVSRPFENEFPGDRTWNRHAASLAVPPNPDLDSLQYTHYQRILRHCGKNLDTAVQANEWCGINSVTTGADYLKLWLASMIQFPHRPLPYLFFYGPQDCGKSMFWEMMRFIISRGIMNAENALTSQSNFNAELEGAVFCVIEEMDLSKSRTQVYNRIKNYITAPTLTIHRKNFTPYEAPNHLHIAHFANSIGFCPTEIGDKRQVFISVSDLDPSELIPKEELELRLQKEAPDFLAALLNVDIPPSNSRLRIPPLETQDKDYAIKLTQNELEAFISEKCHYVPGAYIVYGDFVDEFHRWLDTPEARIAWNKPRVGRELPSQFPKGRLAKLNAAFAIGNISWEKTEPSGPPYIYVPEGNKLVLDG